VDQISPPFRIAIVAMLAVCALWFTVLKPKDPAGADAPLPVAPGQAGLGNAVSAAKGAAGASDAANAKVQRATGGTAATATPAKAAPTPATAKATAAPRRTAKAKPADLAAPLLDALAARKAVVMLFFSRKGIDDTAVRKAVAATDRHRGRVVVKAVRIADVGRYDAITRGAEVLQAPTVLVIAPDRRARAIVGFTTTGELDQAIGDALRPAKRAR
jgi:hypothetical protein